VLAATALQEMERVHSATARKKHIVEAVERVAKRLGNTRAVCRRCYVHPAVFDAYLDGMTIRTVAARAHRMMSRDSTRLSVAESAVLALLQRRLARGAKVRLARAA
jgi:DNA topoisomerase-1